MTIDARWMAAAIALAARGQRFSTPNPNVGCLIIREGAVAGYGWTQAGGRPHAEAMALAMAGAAAQGATAYVTLEPCAHESDRGPACADLLIASGVTSVVIALVDPDGRTAGKGIVRLRDAGIDVITGIGADDARRSMAGWLMRQAAGRPYITLKLACSLDGRIATASGESKWITGNPARAHAHAIRATQHMILVGRGTYDADRPLLDVRVPGLSARSPTRAVLSADPSFTPPNGWQRLTTVDGVHALDPAIHWLLIDGGATTAAAFLRAGLVDRLMLYRAPIMIGAGRPMIADIGLEHLHDAHGRWTLTDRRALGTDLFETYERTVRDDTPGDTERN